MSSSHFYVLKKHGHVAIEGIQLFRKRNNPPLLFCYSDALLTKRNQTLVKVFIVSIALALIAYVTLDTLYFHTFFSAENADIAAMILTMIVIADICLMLLIQQYQNRRRN